MITHMYFSLTLITELSDSECPKKVEDRVVVEAKNVFTFQVKKEHNIPSMDKHYRPITSGIHAYISPISLLILTISLLTVRSKEKCLNYR